MAQNLAPVDEILDLVTKDYVDSQVSSHTHDARYYTESEVDALLGGKSDTGHTHDHGSLTGTGDDDHTQYLNSARHAALFDSTAPAALTPDIAGAAGSTTIPARRDHVHNVPAATAVGISNSSTNTEGNSTSFARANHTHAVTGFALSSHSHSAANITSGTLAVARGGTGIASYSGPNYLRASTATTIVEMTPAQVLSDIGAATSGHNHNTLYYTESEVDTLLDGKSGTSHDHDDELAAMAFLLMGV